MMFFPLLYMCLQFFIHTTYESEPINLTLEDRDANDNEKYNYQEILLANCSVGNGPVSCTCNNITDGCTICCNSHCCNCKDCWDNEWQLVTMTQISISILFLLGIVGVIIAFLKLCNRTTQLENTRPVPMCRRFNTDTINMCNSQCADGYRDRPPPYNEIYGAPPLYTAPFNRMSMLDMPPVYPATPQGQERTIHSNAAPPTVVQHL